MLYQVSGNWAVGVCPIGPLLISAVGRIVKDLGSPLFGCYFFRQYSARFEIEQQLFFISQFGGDVTALNNVLLQACDKLK